MFMGVLKSLGKLVNGDPEERAFKKQVKAEAKLKEKEAFEAQYKVSAIKDAEARGKARAKKAVSNGQGGGLLDSLARVGADMNRASLGVTDGIEINPSGRVEKRRDDEDSGADYFY